MKKKYVLTVVLISVLIVTKLHAQILLNESFNKQWNPTAEGWIVFNNSSPLGYKSWYQGNSVYFGAYNGISSDSYYGVDFFSQAPGPGGISNFLITPTLSLVNGGVIRFATRTGLNTELPDRLQLLMSVSGTYTTIGSGTTAVGPFNTVLLDINPLLSTSTVSAVSNGSVNGYPDKWTVYTTTLSGITGTLDGCFAFRYFVENSGYGGMNGNYIGIDEVMYYLPCVAPPVLTVTPGDLNVCPGTVFNFNAQGANTYLWSYGSKKSIKNPFSYTVSNTPGIEAIILKGEISPDCADTKILEIHVASCTDIEESEPQLTGQSIFPNPFHESVSFSDYNGVVEIYNSVGQLLSKTILGKETKIDTGNLKEGFYTFRIFNEEHTQTKSFKMLKQ